MSRMRSIVGLQTRGSLATEKRRSERWNFKSSWFPGRGDRNRSVAIFAASRGPRDEPCDATDHRRAETAPFMVEALALVDRMRIFPVERSCEEDRTMGKTAMFSRR